MYCKVSQSTKTFIYKLWSNFRTMFLSIKLIDARRKHLLWLDELKFEIHFWKTLMLHHLDYRADGWGCISGYGLGILHIWKGIINPENYMQVLEEYTLPFR